MTPDTLATALDYAARGWRALITAWADAGDVLSATVHTYDSEYMDLLRRERDEAQDALRQAVGR